jgi:hypothetical protein
MDPFKNFFAVSVRKEFPRGAIGQLGNHRGVAGRIQAATTAGARVDELLLMEIYTSCYNSARV